MKIPYFHVDAFTTRVFGGNPAGVVPLDAWLSDETLQSIAAENKHSETAFFVTEGQKYRLRWFTPFCEVELCGHATLATAYVLLNLLEPERSSVSFLTKSGELNVTKSGDLLVMDFPSRPPAPCEWSDALVAALGKRPSALLKARAHLAVYESEEDVVALEPDQAALDALRGLVIVTAPGNAGRTPPVDFVSRFFAPGVGIPEDPVTGSAHSTLVPYWSKRLGKSSLHAVQVSARRGELFCRDLGERTEIAGRAVLYLVGEIELNG